MGLIGKIIRLDNTGLGMVLEEGDEAKVRPFTFDKLSCYRGEKVKELKAKGFKIGGVVKFQIDDKDRISLIQPLVFKVFKEYIGWRDFVEDFVEGWLRFRDSRSR